MVAVTGPMHERTFTSTQVAAVAGCSYRAVDYWTRCGYLVPLVPAHGPGSQRLFDYRQLLRARLLALAAGADVPAVALDPQVLHEQGTQVLGPGLTIELDGAEFAATIEKRIQEMTG